MTIFDHICLSFIKFSVTSPYFRFLALSILLKFKWMYEKHSNNEEDAVVTINIYLSNKYINEKQPFVKILFEANADFVGGYNKNIKDSVFQQKIIDFDIKRKQFLSPLVPDLDSHEYSVKNFEDIQQRIAENANDLWKRSIIERQKNQIA